MQLGFGFFLWVLMVHLYMGAGDDLVCGPFDCLERIGVAWLINVW
ncbi:hypothetical protein EDF68_11194 [Ochrobactrum sp. BH3]|nr:hypothetical protein EDF68_11194 [Ochrobactrum sp. BH3]